MKILFALLHHLVILFHLDVLELDKLILKNV